MLEKNIEQYLTQKAEERGYLCLKFLSTFPGVPDRILFGAGRVYLAEIKNGKKGVVSAIQAYWFEKFKALGFEVGLIRSKEEAEVWVAKLPNLKE